MNASSSSDRHKKCVALTSSLQQANDREQESHRELLEIARKITCHKATDSELN